MIVTSPNVAVTVAVDPDAIVPVVIGKVIVVEPAGTVAEPGTTRSGELDFKLITIPTVVIPEIVTLPVVLAFELSAAGTVRSVSPPGTSRNCRVIEPPL